MNYETTVGPIMDTIRTSKTYPLERFLQFFFQIRYRRRVAERSDRHKQQPSLYFLLNHALNVCRDMFLCYIANSNKLMIRYFIDKRFFFKDILVTFVLRNILLHFFNFRDFKKINNGDILRLGIKGCIRKFYARRKIQPICTHDGFSYLEDIFTKINLFLTTLKS